MIRKETGAEMGTTGSDAKTIWCALPDVSAIYSRKRKCATLWRPCSGVIVYILDASTTSIPGSGSVIVEALLWRNCKYSGCSLCNRKVDDTEL